MSIWSIVSPDFARIFSVAGIGPFSIVIGSTPTIVEVTMRARGVRPCFFTASSDARITTDAPSVICDDEPAVCTPPSITALSVPSFSREVSAQALVALDADRVAGRVAFLVDGRRVHRDHLGL